MSDELEQRITAQFESLQKLVPLMRWFLIGAFILGGWVATLEIRTQAFSPVDERVSNLELWQAETTGSRYTSSDAAKLSQAMTDSLNNHDKRVQRLEDSIVSIQKTLDRIESKLVAIP